MIFINFSWDDSFYAGGVCIAISGFLAYIIGAVRAESPAGEDEDVNNNDETDEQNKLTQRT